MRSDADLLTLLANEEASLEERVAAATRLAEANDEQIAEGLLAIASSDGLPEELEIATGMSLAHVFYRPGRKNEMFALRDLGDATYVAYDETMAAILTREEP